MAQPAKIADEDDDEGPCAFISRRWREYLERIERGGLTPKEQEDKTRNERRKERKQQMWKDFLEARRLSLKASGFKRRV